MSGGEIPRVGVTFPRVAFPSAGADYSVTCDGAFGERLAELPPAERDSMLGFVRVTSFFLQEASRSRLQTIPSALGGPAGAARGGAAARRLHD